MTAELLDLARGKEKSVEEISISDIVKREVSLLQTLAVQKNISLLLEGESLNMLSADKEALSRVFKNIIANAIAYTNKGTVTVWLADTSTETTVSVIDTGIGISEQNLPHVFKRFYKADNGHSSNGSGLGLAIAKHVAEQYNGTISIESIPEKGTTVTVRLPSHSA